VDVERILADLTEAGYRDTGPRRAVVEAIVRRDGAFTVQEVVDELARRGIGRATVFRTVNTLEALGYVSRLHVGQGCDRYALCDGSHHHHLVCVSCGDVYPLKECGVEAAAAAAARRVGFRVEGHHVDVYGRCATCSEEAAAAG
jgi:Fur family ferric uptake transcriptional regulator